MNATPESYKVYAIKYAHNARRSSQNYIAGDTHDVSQPLDFYVWAIVGASRVFMVDTGFDMAMSAKRGRRITNTVEDGLRRIGVEPAAVDDVIITHMHYDHAGNQQLFPKARYHIQDKEMAFCTGRCMCHHYLRRPYEPEDISAMVQRTFDGKMDFHDGDATLTPGLSVHWVGGHTGGMQVVRVHTEQGWMVLASDAAHYYANMEQGRPFPAIYNVADMLEGHARLYSLADRPELVVPGHDPQVLERFAAAGPGLEGWAVRLDPGPQR